MLNSIAKSYLVFIRPKNENIMKKQLPLILAFSFSIVSLSIFGQTDKWVEAPPHVKEFLQERTIAPNIPTGHFKSGSEWQVALDSIWGQGLPTEDKLAQFDILYKTIDEKFACFQDIDDRWEELGLMYRREIEEGVSRGRFVAIMDHMTLSLRESHTGLAYGPVARTTLVPGVPIHMVGGWGFNTHFGAGLTPQEDGRLLVYKVIPEHPLRLKVGDKILGYDGETWETCYKKLLDAQLPMIGFWWGSSPSSFHHSFMMAAGLNWHLFENIDILKYSTGEIISKDLSVMTVPKMPIFCTEQMDIPGVPKPDFENQELVTFGIIEGTNIGYIYGWGWFWDAEEEFTAAINTLMDDYDTDGLVMDFRMNYGGNMFMSNTGLDRLFPDQVRYINYATRCNTVEHLALCPSNAANVYNFGNSSESYDKPIALLTGPGAISSGDQVAMRMKYHPNVRTFGKSTSTAFNAPRDIEFTNPDWTGRYAEVEFYLLENPGDYLTHNEFEVDEPIWLSPELVAEGRDDVVESAVDWILGQGTSTTTIGDTEQCRIFPNPSKGKIVISNPAPEKKTLVIYSLLGEEISTYELVSSADLEIEVNQTGTFVLHILSNEGESQIEKLIITK